MFLIICFTTYVSYGDKVTNKPSSCLALLTPNPAYALSLNITLHFKEINA